ncbi:hypothetical protein ACHAXR_005056 [Thalassiosira sp. AJA248-18]
MSDEKRQDGATTAENINRLLVDIFLNEKDFIMSSLKMLISMCDGCSAQYRSGSVCYELMLLAIQWGIPIHRVIQAPGHGKCICDSQGGLDKTVLDIFFDCLVANPEALVEGLQRVETHDRTEDGLLKRPVGTRYTGTNRNCEYWEIFEREDGTSYNDWKIIELKPKPKEYKEEDDLNRLEVTCTEAPRKADGDRVFERDGNEFSVKEGEWYCEGVWLDKANWHYLTSQKCIVRQIVIVIDADGEMMPLSDDNPFPSNLSNRVCEDAARKGAMMIADGDHEFLMEAARQRTTLDFEDVVYGDVEGCDDDGSVYGEDEGVEIDGEMSEEEF